MNLSLDSDSLDLKSVLLSGTTALDLVHLSSELDDSNLSGELSVLSLQSDDSSVELLATARSLRALYDDLSAGSGASLNESLLGLDKSVSDGGLFSSDGMSDNSSVLLDSSLNLSATALLLVNDDVSVGLGAKLNSAAPLSESLLSSSDLESLFSDLQSALSSGELSSLDSPSSDLTSSTTALLRNGVNSNLNNSSGLGASSDSALENNSSSLDLNNSLVSLDLSVDLFSSTASTALASDDDLLGSLASLGSSSPGLSSELNNLSFSSGSTSSGSEDNLSLLSDGTSPFGNSGLSAAARLLGNDDSTGLLADSESLLDSDDSSSSSADFSSNLNSGSVSSGHL